MKKRRDENEIIVDVLKATQTPRSKYGVFIETKMNSYVNLQKRLDYLISLGLMENINGIYKTSPRGKDLLQKCEAIESVVG